MKRIALSSIVAIKTLIQKYSESIIVIQDIVVQSKICCNCSKKCGCELGLIVGWLLKFTIITMLFGAANAEHATRDLRRIINTQYAQFELFEYDVPEDCASNAVLTGGAFAKLNRHEFIHVSKCGYFYLIGSNSTQKHLPIPKLETSNGNINTSKKYTYIESQPRILGALSYLGNIYVSYNFYDVVADQVDFRVSVWSQHLGWKLIFKTVPLDVHYFALGNGGKIAYLNGSIYFSVGDHSLDRRNGLSSDFAAQNDKMPFGKILYFKLNKPDDIRVCSKGHRNPQGLLEYDGRLVETEHGPRGGDEINIIKCGSNYGWPYSTKGTSYNSYDNNFGYRNINLKFADPLFYFTPSVAITAIIKPDLLNKEWSSGFLVGSLKAMSLFRVHLNGVGFIDNIEPIEVGYRIRDLIQIDNEFWLLADGDKLVRMKLVNKPYYSSLNNFPAIQSCLTTCHSVTVDGVKSFAPSLNGLINRKIASQKYEYSSSLTLKNKLIWSKENLKKYLLYPENFAKGTSMPKQNIREQDVDEIIENLARLGVLP